ncbi:hypothetical protein GcC1_101015 [Golovinomyces cichoracearum]|uniref:Uncharacterized protein n=1 Tax=Golovinomyces cichoracearum TaxID=62708 RepID=A0A420IA35_9PEZI|nr:hypothetical protein GcC1_101015 [Golovinomyces cichoracearum]
MSALARLKSHANRPANETKSQAQTTSKAHRHHFYSHRSKDPFRENRSQAPIPNQNVVSNNLLQESDKNSTERFSANTSRDLATPDHENTVYTVKNEAKRLEERRIERERAAHQVNKLRSAVVEINNSSNMISRRLDNTCYSILEKFSSLQSMIMSLKELSTTTRQCNVKFASDYRTLAHESHKQLDSLDSSKDQAKRLSKLMKRVDNSRQKFLCLGERVKIVRERVEKWETSEREWKNKTGKRLKILWSCSGGVMTLVLFIYVLSWWVSGRTDGKKLEYTQITPTVGTTLFKTNSEGFCNPIDQTTVLDRMKDRYTIRNANSNERQRKTDEL